jgi:hypothetical protein
VIDRDTQPFPCQLLQAIRMDQLLPKECQERANRAIVANVD